MYIYFCYVVTYCLALQVTELSETIRGSGGFGSTGVAREPLTDVTAVPNGYKKFKMQKVISPICGSCFQAFRIKCQRYPLTCRCTRATWLVSLHRITLQFPDLFIVSTSYVPYVQGAPDFLGAIPQLCGNEACLVALQCFVDMRQLSQFTTAHMMNIPSTQHHIVHRLDASNIALLLTVVCYSAFRLRKCCNMEEVPPSAIAETTCIR